MAKSTSLPFTQDINNGFAAFTNADAALTAKTLFTADADDEVVKCIQIASDDTSARVVDLLINNGSTDYLLGSVSVPAASGTNGTTAAVDALAAGLFPGLPMDAVGKRVLPLKGGYALKVRNQAQITAAKTLTVTTISEKY